MLLPVSHIVWSHLPKLEFVEFPWRWLLVSGACVTLLVSGALSHCRPYWLALVLFGLAALGGTVSGGTALWRPQMISGLQARIRAAGGYEGSSPYMPPQANPDALYANRAMPLAVAADANAEVRIVRWAAEYKSLRVQAAAPTSLTLRLLAYPAWQAEVNRHRIASHADELGRMVVPVPGGDSRVEVRFVRTPDRSAGILISLLAMALIVIATRFKPGGFHHKAQREPKGITGGMASFKAVPLSEAET
jgi:hypothetical protein